MNLIDKLLTDLTLSFKGALSIMLIIQTFMIIWGMTWLNLKIWEWVFSNLSVYVNLSNFTNTVFLFNVVTYFLSVLVKEKT